MSRARRNDSSPVQLFPFLAVLMSVMGALILLLLAFNQQAARQAIAAAVERLVQKSSDEERSLEQRKNDLEITVASLRSQITERQSRELHVEQQLVDADARVHTDLTRIQA